MTFFNDVSHSANPLRQASAREYLADETKTVKALAQTLQLSQQSLQRIKIMTRALVESIRVNRHKRGGLDAFMHEYDLSSEEGVLLMCLAESFLRIPDIATADKLIADKIGGAHWHKHLGKSDSLFANASTWALMLTGKLLEQHEFENNPSGSVLDALLERLGEPLLRKAVAQGMQIIARQFVMGGTIQQALHAVEPLQQKGYTFSYDMLGEAAYTASDAKRYLNAYQKAIQPIGNNTNSNDPQKMPGLSIKLSALHPRYETSQRARVMHQLLPEILKLIEQARQAGVLLTLDAEEADRQELCFDLVEALIEKISATGWKGFGVALQAYQKRAFIALDWLEKVAIKHRCALHVRLVKGAYWDTEIKRAQQLGLENYPVFTRKVNTDVSYLACARKLLHSDPLIYPQFATHNAQTVASVIEMAGARKFEFQRLHGMGEVLYDQLLDSRKDTEKGINCRVYAPVGSHHDLLPYLVRRLLENGANTSFINRVNDDFMPLEKMVQNPLQVVQELRKIPNPRIPLPQDLFQPERQNSTGLDLSSPFVLHMLKHDMRPFQAKCYHAKSLIDGVNAEAQEVEITNPAHSQDVIGWVQQASAEQIMRALKKAASAADAWGRTSASSRAQYLVKIAESYEQHRPELLALLLRESGKTLRDALSEVREAVDFCRYYASQCEKKFAGPMTLTGPTGESNRLGWHGRGVFACISPWNFPLAIFTGQIVAALAAGNSVLAKAASNTPLIAHFSVNLMHQAGVPQDVLQLLIAPGSTIGPVLFKQDELAGVVFTGGLDSAQQIQRELANRPGPIIPFIAETGGLNAMIADSSALTEQLVSDAIESAFNSAGQRCSALRILYLQDEIADKTVRMLTGALHELLIGDPARLETDIGPLIDQPAKIKLQNHVRHFTQTGKLIYQCQLPQECAEGHFFGPCVLEIENIRQLEGETFGPALHICRYRADDIEQVITDINRTRYGLTLGIHSRINKTIDYLASRLKVGNIYVNRNQIGALVGVQPFGGEGLSGTGPKAGGPHYLHRFATERVVTINTTAQGGNVSLLAGNN